MKPIDESNWTINKVRGRVYEVCVSSKTGEIVILGVPGDNDSEETGHSCDLMAIHGFLRHNTWSWPQPAAIPPTAAVAATIRGTPSHLPGARLRSRWSGGCSSSGARWMTREELAKEIAERNDRCGVVENEGICLRTKNHSGDHHLEPLTTTIPIE